MGFAKSVITKVTNRLKKEGFNVKRSHGYRYSNAYVERNGKWVYLSADDDFSPVNGKMLVRTAKDDRDSSGGPNNHVSICNEKNDFSKVIALAKKLTE